MRCQIISVQRNDELWGSIRATTEQLTAVSARLREAAAEACQTAQARQQHRNRLHLELLQNLKRLADQVRDVLWQELKMSPGEAAAGRETKGRAEGFLELLNRLAAPTPEGTPPQSFFEQIESAVDRTLDESGVAGCGGVSQGSKAA